MIGFFGAHFLVAIIAAVSCFVYAIRLMDGRPRIYSGRWGKALSPLIVIPLVLAAFDNLLLGSAMRPNDWLILSFSMGFIVFWIMFETFDAARLYLYNAPHLLILNADDSTVKTRVWDALEDVGINCEEYDPQIALPDRELLVSVREGWGTVDVTFHEELSYETVESPTFLNDFRDSLRERFKDVQSASVSKSALNSLLAGLVAVILAVLVVFSSSIGEARHRDDQIMVTVHSTVRSVID